MQQYAELLEGRVCILLMSLSPGDRAGPEDILNEGEGERQGIKGITLRKVNSLR